MKYIIAILRQIRGMCDLLWDFRLNINTCGIIIREDSTSRNRDAQKYEPSSYLRLYQIFKRIPVRDTDVIADYGCGRGRTVCFAARLLVKKVYGIELYPDIALTARRNAQTVRNRKAEVEIIEGDVLNFHCGDVTIFFFYNPFGPQTMQDVLNRIHTTLSENPRNILVILFSPQIPVLVAFDKFGWLHQREDLRIGKAGKPAVLFYENMISAN